MRHSIIDHIEMLHVAVEFRGGLPAAVIITGAFISDQNSGTKRLGRTGDIRIPLIPDKNPMLVRVVNALCEELSAWLHKKVFGGPPK